MTNSAKEQATAMAHVSSLKMTQKDILAALNSQAHLARKASENAKAKKLTQMSIKLSQQNLAIHRAKQAALKAEDLGSINAKLGLIAAQSDKIRQDLKGVVDTLAKASEFIGLLRRFIDVLS